MAEYLNYLTPLHDFFAAAATFAESNLVTALLGSLAGAFGGAWAAQRIANKNKLRDDLLKEIRNTNAAAMMLYGIANSHLGMKSEHIQSMRDKYEEEQTKLDLFLKAKKAGTVPPRQTFEFTADLQTLKPLLSPTEPIQRLMFDQISITGAALSVLPILLATIQSLNETLTDRNHIVEDWKKDRPPNLIQAYFGMEHDSVVDQRYKMLVEAIYRQTDDVIAFSMMIGDALHEHAKDQRQKLRSHFRIDGPTINKVDFSRFDKSIPPADEYTNFAKMLEITRPTPKKSRWQLIREKIKVPKWGKI